MIDEHEKLFMPPEEFVELVKQYQLRKELKSKLEVNERIFHFIFQ